MINEEIYKISKIPELKSVEASAGTGKTTCLSLRYINLLLEGYKPENAVAVTFTNKATNEMKEKIISFLKKRALNLKDCEDFLKIFDNLKCQKILEEILFKFHNFRITTIDSFLTLLGKNFSFTFNFPPEVEFTLSGDVFVEKALKEYFERVLPDSKEGIDFLDYFRKTLSFKEDIKWNFLEIVCEDINNLLTIEKKTGKDIALPGDMHYINKLENEIREMVKKVGPDKFQRKQVIEFCNGKRELISFKLEAKKGFDKEPCIKEIFEKYENYKKDYPRYLKFPNQKIYENLKSSINDFIEKEGLVPLDFLNKKLKEEILKLDFPLKYITISEKISHFLIDEFQDTSPSQWVVLMPLIENLLSQGGTFFYVGDKKQAIYEFRGGDYTIFDLAKEIKCVKDSIITKDLNENYRSKKEIVEFVKDTFSENNLKRALARKLEEKELKEILNHFEKVKDSVEKKDGQGYVRVISLGKIKKNDEEEKPEEGKEEENANDIRENIRDYLVKLLKEEILNYYDLEDIAILVRKNSEARDILIKLLENDIPSISPSALGLLSSNTIKEIINFLKFINNPEDELIFAQVLLSDIFIKNTDKKREEFEEYIFNLKKNGKNYLLSNFKNDFNVLYENYFKEILYLSPVLTPYEITTKIYRKFNILKNFSEEEGFFYAFLEYLSYLQDEGIVTLEEVIEKIKNISKEEPKVLFPLKTPQIKVMTIHKAKGLQFPVVIVPFLSIYIDPRNFSFYEKEEEVVKPCYLNKDMAKKTGLEYLYYEARKKYLIEELNTFYVALTRAEEALFVILPNYKDGTNVFLREKGENKAFGVLPKRKTKKEEKKEIFKIGDFPGGNWAEKISRDFVDLEIYQNLERYKKIKEGIELHKKIQNGDLENIPKKFLKIINPKGYFKRDFEKEIVDKDGNIYRTDLLIHLEESIFVVDFKFGEKRKKDLEQIKNYIKLIKEIEKKKVKGFLLYFEKGEVLEIND